MNGNQWFEVDRKGLGKILRRRGIEFAVFELIQNAWDEAGVTEVDVTLNHSGRNRAELTITDNSAGGFQDLSHAFTLFAESSKKSNAELRGRFNLGEKLVIALCSAFEVLSTTGRVTFGDSGRRVQKGSFREVGTKISALLKMTAEEVKEVQIATGRLIPPAHITTTFNGIQLVTPTPVKQFDASLQTEIADDEGSLRAATRTCAVAVYEVAAGDTARIYEMGIPVVEHDCAFNVDVQQKVPLTLDRENVSTRFLRALRVAVFNATHEIVTAEQTTAEWAQTAIEHPDVEPAAVHDYMGKRFGDKRVSYDPSDPEANNRAVAAGFTLVHGGMLSKAAWGNAREFTAIEPAGRLFPTHPGGGIPHEDAEQTSGMKAVAEYAKKLAEVLLGCAISVDFGKQKSREDACWGNRNLQFNVTNLGIGWFDLHGNRLAIDGLIIHEFGHHYASNHLSEDYYRALTRLAAKAMEAARAGKI